MYVYYCRTYEKAVSGGGEREKGGDVLRDTTSLSRRGFEPPESGLYAGKVAALCMFTGGPGTKLCAGERGEVRDMC